MTYALFLALFLVIPILLLGLATWRDFSNGLRSSKGFNSFPAWLAVAIHVLVAVIYTTPWDNYLVATGVWYYNPRLVTGITLGCVLQKIMTCKTFLWLSRRVKNQATRPLQTSRVRSFSVVGLSILWLSMLAVLISGWEPMTYLSLILVWALPPVIVQMAFGADILWRYRRTLGLALGSVAVYLGLMDSLAINAGTWTIDPAQSLNIFLGGVLPVEEFVFFLMTNVLITFGLTLLLSQEGRQRWNDLKDYYRGKQFYPNSQSYEKLSGRRAETHGAAKLQPGDRSR
ncbi:MAG: lycopene cyclase domain-containing protein [Anaerolineales bacterium]